MLPVTTRPPSGVTAIDEIGPVCPRRVRGSRRRGGPRPWPCRPRSRSPAAAVPGHRDGPDRSGMGFDRRQIRPAVQVPAPDLAIVVPGQHPAVRPGSPRRTRPGCAPGGPAAAGAVPGGRSGPRLGPSRRRPRSPIDCHPVRTRGPRPRRDDRAGRRVAGRWRHPRAGRCRPRPRWPARRPSGREGRHRDPAPVPDQGPVLEMAHPPPVIPLEPAFRVISRLGQQRVKEQDITLLPRLLHQVHGRGVPVPECRASATFVRALGGRGDRRHGQREQQHGRRQGRRPAGLRRHQRHSRSAPADRPGHGSARRPGTAAGRRPAPRPRRSAAPGSFCRHFRQIVSRSRGSPRLQPRRRHRLGRPDLLERLQHRRRPERRPAGQQLVEDRPQGVDVGRRADLPGLPRGLLGGHVAGRAQDRAGPRQARRRRRAAWPGRSR